MHEYYAANRDKLKKGMDKFLSLVAPELEKVSGKNTQNCLRRSGITTINSFLNDSPMLAVIR